MQLKSFREYVELKQGLAINKGTDYLISNVKDSEFTIPLLRIADMVSGTFSKYVSKKVNPNVIAGNSDIIYTRTGQIGLVFKDYIGVVHNNSFIVSIKKEKEMELNKDYLFTILNSNFVRKQAMSLANSSVQPDLTHEMFKDMWFPLPNIKEQERIAEIYVSLTKKIDNNMKVVKTLEYMAKTLYDYWFVQFDFPDANGRPYKTSGGKMEWNETLSREIPAEWEVKKIKEIADVIAGGDKPEEYSAIKTEKYTVPIYTNGVDKDGLYGYCEAGRVNEDSITIGARGNIGYTKFRQGGYLPIIRLISVTPKDQRYLEYLGFFLKEYPYRKNGSVQNQLPVPDVEDIMIVVPDVSLVEKYHEHASLCLNKYYLIKDEIEELCSLRDFLLPMLMNGQVTFNQ